MARPPAWLRAGSRRLDRETILAMKAKGEGPAAIAKALGISRMSVQRVLAAQETLVAPARATTRYDNSRRGLLRSPV